MKKSHADAMFVFEDPVFRAQSARIVEFAAKNRLSAVYGGSPVKPLATLTIFSWNLISGAATLMLSIMRA